MRVMEAYTFRCYQGKCQRLNSNVFLLRNTNVDCGNSCLACIVRKENLESTYRVYTYAIYSKIRVPLRILGAILKMSLMVALTIYPSTNENDVLVKAARTTVFYDELSCRVSLSGVS